MILAGAHTRHRLEGELGEGRRALRLRRMFRMLLRFHMGLPLKGERGGGRLDFHILLRLSNY